MVLICSVIFFNFFLFISVSFCFMHFGALMLGGYMLISIILFPIFILVAEDPESQKGSILGLMLCCHCHKAFIIFEQ